MGVLLIFLLNIATVICQYDYRRPFRLREGDKYVTNTQNWTLLENGEHSYILTIGKHSPDICSLKFSLKQVGNIGYLDCNDEYLLIGNEKICGELKEQYLFPFGDGQWHLRYRGRSTIVIGVEEVKCRGNEFESYGYHTCDVTSQELNTEITSPNYPREYPPMSNCQYTILPANEAICQVSIHFHDFDVEDATDCRKDRLLIGNEPFCGKIKNYRTNRNFTNNMIMRFISDSLTGGRFKMNVQQIHCGNTLRYQGNGQEPVRECCMREYRDTYMILSSPHLLDSQWTQANCRYTIFQSHPSACRLRFHFKHFWVGEDDVFYGCVNGYLEIDGRQFCGCLDGLEYISHFDPNGKKELYYTNRGMRMGGFAIEVYQEECHGEHPFTNSTDVDPNTEIEVFTTNTTSEKALSQFLESRDTSRCANEPKWRREVREFLDNAPIPSFCDSYSARRNPTASQFYPPPDDGEFPNEEPALPPLEIPPLIPPVFRPPIHPPANCLIFEGFQGRFYSPLYDWKYPPNLRLCYRFQALPGFCSVKLSFLDFNLEKSFKCWKDYVNLGGNSRYCGNYLRRKSAVLPVRNGGFVDMLFVTDSCFSGRGFSGLYYQLPCGVPYAKVLDEKVDAKKHGNVTV